MYSKKFPFALQTIFSIHNLEADNFFQPTTACKQSFYEMVCLLPALVYPFCTNGGGGGGGGRADLLKGFSSITSEKHKFETPNFAYTIFNNMHIGDIIKFSIFVKIWEGERCKFGEV